MTLNFCKNIKKKSNNNLEKKRPEGCDGSMLKGHEKCVQ